jgi:hypothetical protein
MSALHRPTLRELIRVVAVGIVIVFTVCAVALAYAAGRHAGREESSPRSQPSVVSATSSGHLG